MPVPAPIDRPMRPWVAMTPLLLLAVYIALIMLAERHILFGRFLLPLGDNAADDLLIVDAKHLQLLHGNYSRIGFYHPGPFFLDIEAAGEVMFYDWTHAFSSYFAGQIFAVSLMHGVALALAYRLALCVAGRIGPALVALLVIAATIATPLHSANPFIELWNPDSYIAAALFAATGLTGLLLRGPSWLPLLVLGCAALVHGHASFVGIVPMMLVIAILLSLALGRLPFRPWDARGAWAWARRHRGACWISLAIMAVFAVPLVLDLILHWPGQFPLYLQFAGTVPPQPFGAAVAYVAWFIPGYGVWALLLLAPPGGAARPDAAPVPADLRAAAVVLLVAGTVPAIWYAWRGIDDLEYRYLLLWFTPFAGVALVLTLAYVLAAFRVPDAGRRGAGLVAAGLAALVLGRMTPWKLDIPANEAMQRAVAQVLAMPRPAQRSELYLDPAPGAAKPAWGETVSLLAALKRAGRNDFCIDPASWNVLFTAPLECDERHETLLRNLRVSLAAHVTGTPVLRLRDYVIETLAARTFPPQADVATALADGMRLDAGWSGVEPWGVWSTGSSATLSFDAEILPKRFDLTLTGELLAPPGQTQTVRFLDSDGHVLGVITGTAAGRVTLPISHRGVGGRISVTLQIEHPVAPAAIGPSKDHRTLGFGLKSVAIAD